LNYKRTWKDLRNAVAFAVECAKIARPYYTGDYAKDVDHAIDLADRFARGEHVDVAAAFAAAYAANAAADAANAAASAVYAAASAAANAAADAAYAARAATNATNATNDAAEAAADAAEAAADAAEAAADAAEAAANAAAYAAYADAKAQVTEAFYKWTAIDLGTVFGTEPWHAAMALLKVGNGEAIVKAYLEGRA
jgi:hypothetical protein